MKYGAIILAGGKGERFNGQKQFETLEEIPLWKHVYNKVLLFIEKDNICIVGIDVPGGETRSKSVINGLMHLSFDTDRVIILESARPLVSEEQIKALKDDDGESSTYVMPLVNSIIKKNGEYVNRTDYLQLLTPQAFSYKHIKEAYESGKYEDYTDETRVMYEHYRIKPNFLTGNEFLYKVTYQNDLNVIRSLLERMKKK
jgi:2-C-methyl-D-erythritol 4-phosphate cytidylyltransferase